MPFISPDTVEGNMPVPDGYKEIQAHEDSIQKARETKKELGLTWNEYLERAAIEFDANSED